METQASIDAMIATFEGRLEGRPNHAIGLVGLAEVVEDFAPFANFAPAA